MKRLIKIFFALLLFIGLEKTIRTQTDGFRVGKTVADFPYQESWEVENEKLDPDTLNQRFHFLGSGVQAYVFLGEDNTTVLKIFKQYHIGLGSRILQKLPMPKCLRNMREEILEKRFKRIDHIFTSCKISLTDLKEQTGVFHLNLNQTQNAYPTITVFDRINIAHQINLNQTPFLLQEKAELLFSYLKNHPEESKEIIDSLFTCIDVRSKKGISNSDPILEKNFGVCRGKIIEIDTGSFRYNGSIKAPLFSKRELFFETLEFKDWITKNSPDLTDYFDEKLMRAIRT